MASATKRGFSESNLKPKKTKKKAKNYFFFTTFIKLCFGDLDLLSSIESSMQEAGKKRREL